MAKPRALAATPGSEIAGEGTMAGRLAGVALTAFEAAFGALACGGGAGPQRACRTWLRILQSKTCSQFLPICCSWISCFLSLACQNGYVGLLTIIPGFGRSEVVMKFTQRC